MISEELLPFYFSLEKIDQQMNSLNDRFQSLKLDLSLEFPEAFDDENKWRHRRSISRRKYIEPKSPKSSSEHQIEEICIWKPKKTKNKNEEKTKTKRFHPHLYTPKKDEVEEDEIYEEADSNKISDRCSEEKFYKKISQDHQKQNSQLVFEELQQQQLLNESDQHQFKASSQLQFLEGNKSPIRKNKMEKCSERGREIKKSYLSNNRLSQQVVEILKNPETQSPLAFIQLRDQLVEKYLRKEWEYLKLSEEEFAKREITLKRRIYDCINVLQSLGVIEKDSKKIRLTQKFKISSMQKDQHQKMIVNMKKRKALKIESIRKRQEDLKRAYQQKSILSFMESRPPISQRQTHKISYPVRIFSSKTKVKKNQIITSNPQNIKIICDFAPVDEKQLIFNAINPTYSELPANHMLKGCVDNDPEANVTKKKRGRPRKTPKIESDIGLQKECPIQKSLLLNNTGEKEDNALFYEQESLQQNHP